MFHNQHLNNKINKLHEYSLWFVYNDKQSWFGELSAKDNSLSINHRNIQSLTDEIYKVKNRSLPEIIVEIIQLRESSHQNLCQASQFIIPHVNSVFNVSESVPFLGA